MVAAVQKVNAWKITVTALQEALVAENIVNVLIVWMGKLRIKRIKKEGKIEGDSDNDTILPIFFQHIFLNKNF